MDIELTEPKTEEEFEGYYGLRYERLRRPLGMPPGSERDSPAEASSVHVIAKVDDRVVGAACWVVGMEKEEQTGSRQMFVRIRQVAIDSEFESHGIGIAMMRHMEEAALKIGAKRIMGSVRPDRVGYFGRRGYALEGTGETLINDIPHVTMSKPLG